MSLFEHLEFHVGLDDNWCRQMDLDGKCIRHANKSQKEIFALATETSLDLVLGRDCSKSTTYCKGFGHTMSFNFHIHHLKCIPCRRHLITEYTAAHCLMCSYVCSSTAPIPALEWSADINGMIWWICMACPSPLWSICNVFGFHAWSPVICWARDYRKYSIPHKKCSNSASHTCTYAIYCSYI